MLDGYYIVGELDESTSYPTMLQVTAGSIDKADINNGIIQVEKTIQREVKEEINIDLNNKDKVLSNQLSYIYLSGENEQPGIQIFSKAKINMTAEQMNAYFKEYYEYLKQNSLEIEFKKLHFLKKEKALEQLTKLDNPKRGYLKPLIELDSQYLEKDLVQNKNAKGRDDD